MKRLEWFVVVIGVLLSVGGLSLFLYGLTRDERMCAEKACPQEHVPARIQGRCVCFTEAK